MRDLVSLSLHPAYCGKDGRFLVERRDDFIRVVVSQWFAARATIDPDSTRAKLTRCGKIKMRAGADLHRILHADAVAFRGMMEDLAEWLVGTGLFRDDPE
ncbi:hypothetical protein [Neorhizobium sp. T6_25]|uniref:hypothetical protein n=1 Tax=Neorhizobium sp. T6_25 TaxID=2093833 RepID=UPI00155E1130|nr:hypothetical protein [Neorhizobium sp. T6_25]